MYKSLANRRISTALSRRFYFKPSKKKKRIAIITTNNLYGHSRSWTIIYYYYYCSTAADRHLGLKKKKIVFRFLTDRRSFIHTPQYSFGDACLLCYTRPVRYIIIIFFFRHLFLLENKRKKKNDFVSITSPR